MGDDLDEEDQHNITEAVAMKKYCRTPFRLMLLRPSSLSLAVRCGINRTRLCTWNLMKPAVLSQNSRIQGWANLVFCTANSIGASNDAIQYLKDCEVPDAYLDGLKN